MWTLAVLIGLALFMASCTRGALSRLTRPPSPHDGYAERLRGAGLDQTALGRDWLLAGERAFEQPVVVELPFRESGYFPPEQPSAVVYQFPLRRGRVLAVDASFETIEQGRLFVDLFRVDAGNPPQRITSMPQDAAEFSQEIDEDGDYLLRVQPELLRGGRYTVAERTLASLPFPVPGLTSRAVQSGFGAARDAGIRQHEGIDIFTAAGTPVVAVTGGVARPGTNNLGGNVVWLQDATRRRAYYYAHLERAALSGTSMVTAGQVLGYVGNTGNARTTAPHLHFGIYAGGAINPLPFLEVDETTPPAPQTTLPLGELARVRTPRSSLRRGSTAAAAVASTLSPGTLVTVLGATGRVLRVALPDQSVGYLPAASLTAAETPLSKRQLPAGAVIRERPSDAAPVVHVAATAVQADVLGRFGGYDLIRAPAARGWLASAGAGGGN